MLRYLVSRALKKKLMQFVVFPSPFHSTLHNMFSIFFLPFSLLSEKIKKNLVRRRTRLSVPFRFAWTFCSSSLGAAAQLLRAPLEPGGCLVIQTGCACISHRAREKAEVIAKGTQTSR